MENYKEKIDKIRNGFKEYKAQCYPLVNTMLAEKEEYIKSLYFRILCMLLKYADVSNETQALYLYRLIAGAKTENTFQDYLKMAMEIELKNIEEFISIFSKDKLRYYFCIDGAILLSIVSNNRDYRLLAELIEMLGIKKEELNYLMAIARSICLQNVEELNKANSLYVDSIKELEIYPYIKEFYSGDIVNTPTLLHITSCDNSELDLSQYKEILSQKVIIENIKCIILKDLIFKGCFEVIIKNCKFIGDISNFKFYNIGKVTIENCEFDNFSNRVAYFNNVNEIFCVRNNFKNCGYTGDTNTRGGIFYGQGSKTNFIVLKGNTLIDSYVARLNFNNQFGCSGIFMATEDIVNTISVTDNYFTGCECKENRDYIEAYVSGCFDKVEKNNNACVGSVKRIFENY